MVYRNTTLCAAAILGLLLLITLGGLWWLIFPEKITIGVINVSIGGCKIELFDKDYYQTYMETAPDWMKGMVNEYDEINMAVWLRWQNCAQKDGGHKKNSYPSGANQIPMILFGQKGKVGLR